MDEKKDARMKKNRGGFKVCAASALEEGHREALPLDFGVVKLTVEPLVILLAHSFRFLDIK
jgi:hypothetical protein